MRVTKFYISQILEELCTLLSGISKTVSASGRKAVSQKQMQDFVVVSFPTNIPENKVVQATTLRIDLAARNTANGLENTRRLQEPSRRYTVSNPTLVLKGDDGLGFSHWLINADILINQTDSYQYS